VFLLSGLWHGAGWNFIIWGIYHGTFLVTERIIGLERFQKIPYVLRWIYSFLVVMTGWVFFRVEDLQKAMQHISVMYSFKTNPSHFVLHNDFPFMAGVGLIFAIFIWLPFGKKIQEWWWSDEAGSLQKNIMARLITCILLYMLSLSFLTSLNFNPFIYFRF
jgi:alginate O-acetyltransferase complex protein AlgI